MESDTDESVPGNIVQKLREDGLLVPEESITTLNIVGEGKFYKNEWQDILLFNHIQENMVLCTELS